MIRGASMTACGTYRYRLWRRWLIGKGVVLWVMFNPSTADADVDDPTVRRLVSFSEAWGYAGLVVVNLFAFRATDPVGLANNDWIRGALEGPLRPSLVISAWGSGASRVVGHRGRAAEVLEILSSWSEVHRHPLYLKRDTPLVKMARSVQR